MVTKQKCVKLADYCDRYRCEGDLDELVAEKMAAVRQAAKCPHASDLFVSYVEKIYLPFVLDAKKPSTYAGYKACFERYIKPRTEKYALRDFTVAIVAQLLKDIARTYKVNRDTVTKVRSLLSGIFTSPANLDNMAKRSIRKALKAANIVWPEWYALRRFLGTQVRMEADSEIASKALGNSKEVADKHYIKPAEVLPDVRRAVKSAVSGLIS